MRILLTPLALLLLAPSLPAMAQSSSANLRVPARCSPPGAEKAARSATPVAPQKLGELPPASAIAAVWRFDEKGCPRPVVLKRGIGANPDKAVEPAGHAAPHPIR